MQTAFSRSGSVRRPASRTQRNEKICRIARCRMPPPAAAAATPAGGGGGSGDLIDPSVDRPRRVIVPQKLDPATLEDIRKAEAFGPRGLLLIGMDQPDCAAVDAWFQRMEPGFVVSACPAALQASGTLRQAVEGEASGSSGSSSAATLPARGWEAQPADAPPVVFFSGMSGAEQVAVMEGWEEHTGLQPPAFASVTPAILDKPLYRLLADIVRAQAQQPPPGYDDEVVAEVQAAAAAAAGAAAAGSGGSSGAAPGGEAQLRSKLQDYVMLNAEGQAGGAPMSLDALKEQIQEKVRAKKAAQAAADKRARKEQSQDDTDRLRQALRSGKAGKKQQQGPKSAGGGKGFGG